MPLRPASAAAASTDSDDDGPPVLPLIQEVFAHLPSPPPLPPLEDDVEVDIHPGLPLHEDGSSAGSDRMSAVEAIVVDESSARVIMILLSLVPMILDGNNSLEGKSSTKVKVFGL